MSEHISPGERVKVDLLDAAPISDATEDICG